MEEERLVAVVGSEEFVIGFQLVGVGRSVVTEQREIDSVLKGMLSEEGIGIIIVSEEDIGFISQRTMEDIERTVVPVVVFVGRKSDELLRERVKMVMGVDLVREQLLIAAGEKISLQKKSLQPRGHAIECRINAEDAENGFRPCPGRVGSPLTMALNRSVIATAHASPAESGRPKRSTPDALGGPHAAPLHPCADAHPHPAAPPVRHAGPDTCRP